MLKPIKGCKISTADKLREEYEIRENLFTANIDADKISDVFKAFIQMQTAPVFFILELPSNKDDENKLGKDNCRSFHKDIYYIDGLNAEKAVFLLEKYGDILINDGLGGFGFGSHDGTAEIMKQKYNVVTLWAKTPQKYESFFEAHNIPQTKKLITAWDTFTPEAPGTAFTYESNGLNIYALLEKLKEQNIYFAERREA